MIKHSIVLALAICALSCSEKESEEPWGLVGTVKGRVTPLSEFGAPEESKGGATVSFQMGQVNKQATSDEAGEYTAADVPMGTYNVVLEKQGFAPVTIRGLRVIGGAQPLYANYTITRPSTTTVTNLTVGGTSNNYVNLTGTVNHSSTSYFPFVRLVIFVGASADVSPKKHASSATYYFNEASGGTLTSTVYINQKVFPSGSTAYIVAYGVASSSYTIVDPDTGLYEYAGLGATPSNVASVQIP